MNGELAIKAGGRYKFIRRKAVLNADGEFEPGPIVEETPWCKNIFTNTYFNKALTVGFLRPLGCVVGTGNTLPTVGDSALASYLAATGTIQDFALYLNATTSPRYVRKVFTYRFGLGVAAGNVAEVGVVDVATGITSGTAPMSRALVLDEFGAPTVVSVLSDEYLDVIWDATWYLPEDVTGTTNISLDGVPTAHTWKIRPYRMNTIGGDRCWGGYVIGVGFGNLVNADSFDPLLVESSTLLDYADPYYSLGTSSRGDSIVGSTYVANSKTREFTFNFGLDKGNFTTGIGKLIIQNDNNYGTEVAMAALQVQIAPKIMKVNTKTLALKVRFTLSNA